MKTREKVKRGAVFITLYLAGVLLTLQAQDIRSMDYVVRTAGRIFVVTNHQSALLKHPLYLTPDLRVLTNGIIKITGGADRKLEEGRKLSFDGFWMNEDGTLVQFNPHYLMKERELFYVEDGIFNRVHQDVIFQNGAVLTAEGMLMTPDQRLMRLQDGQALTVDGQTLPALDQVMMSNGKLVLQKDGSIINLPLVSTMGMSDWTRVKASGVILTRGGEQIILREGQRLIIEGAAMRAIE